MPDAAAPPGQIRKVPSDQPLIVSRPWTRAPFRDDASAPPDAMRHLLEGRRSPTARVAGDDHAGPSVGQPRRGVDAGPSVSLFPRGHTGWLWTTSADVVSFGILRTLRRSGGRDVPPSGPGTTRRCPAPALLANPCRQVDHAVQDVGEGGDLP